MSVLREPAQESDALIDKEEVVLQGNFCGDEGSKPNAELEEQYFTHYTTGTANADYAGERKNHLADLAAQGNKCAICATRIYYNRGSRSNPVSAALDHCHISGEFRGWLCGRCNSGLGLLDDEPALLRKAAEYIEAHRKQSKFFR